MICDYGCGQEARYQFKNGKWCCEKLVCKCPGIRIKNSKSSSGERHPFFGVTGKETPFYEKSHSEETKQKMSRNNSRYWKGKTFSEETRKKLSISHKNISEETRKKMSESHKGEKNHNFGKEMSEKSKRKCLNLKRENTWIQSIVKIM